LQSEEEPAAVGQMFVRVARICCFLGVYLNVTLILLGTDFLHQWVGGAFATSEARWILTWLGLAAMCQVLSISVPLPFYQSLDRLRFPVLVMLVEAVVNLMGSVWLAQVLGASGVAFATFVPAACITLVLVPRHLSRILNLQFGRTMLTVLFPSMLVAASTWAVVWGLDALLPYSSYLILAVKAGAAGLAAGIVFLVTFPAEDRDLTVGPVVRLLRLGAGR
jgi:peptidoglycan biosynthesis protein MviN/MurJ (putative lipid II flippase)